MSELQRRYTPPPKKVKPAGRAQEREVVVIHTPRVVQSSSIASSAKSRTTAGILAILLGGLGVHKFYLEQVGLGLVYLLFSCTLVPAIIGFIEGIIYLTMSDDAFYDKYVAPYVRA